MVSTNNRKVFIVGPDAAMMTMFRTQGGFQGVHSVEEADIVVFTGGADVHPSVYGEEEDPAIPCYYNEMRDKVDLAVWEAAKDKFKVGVCRGGQFLNVMNGGKLWYDVNQHTQSHMAYEPMDGGLNIPFMVTSTHHQMFIKGPTAHVFLVAYQSTRKVNANDQWVNTKGRRSTKFNYDTNLYEPPLDDEDDLEGLYYAETGSMCFQPHPEYEGPGSKMRTFFFNKLDSFYQSWMEQQQEKVA